MTFELMVIKRVFTLVREVHIFFGGGVKLDEKIRKGLICAGAGIIHSPFGLGEIIKLAELQPGNVLIFHLAWSFVQTGSEKIDQTVGQSTPAVDSVRGVKAGQLTLAHLRSILIEDLWPQRMFGFGPGGTAHSKDPHKVGGCLYAGIEQSSALKGILLDLAVCRFVIVFNQISSSQKTNKGLNLQVSASLQRQRHLWIEV